MSDSNLKLNDLTKFRLDEINKVKEYLNSEINERKEVLKKLSKYIVVFDYTFFFISMRENSLQPGICLVF